MLAKYDVCGTINIHFNCGCELCLDIKIFYDSSIVTSTECEITRYELCEKHDIVDIDNIDCYEIFNTIEREYYHKLIKQYDSEAQVYVALLELYDDIEIGEDLDRFLINDNDIDNDQSVDTTNYCDIQRKPTISTTLEGIFERANQIENVILSYVQKIKDTIKGYVV